MSVLREPGDLAHTPLAALLIAALNEKASGVLTVDHPKGTSRLYLRTGMPVGAQTFMDFKPLGQHLLQRGLIDIVALNESLAGMARTGQPQGRILVEMGAIDQTALETALAEQQAGYVTRIAGLDAGAYRFDGGASLPEWTRAVRISPLKVIVDALQQPQAVHLVDGALGQAGDSIALAPEYRQVAEKFGWTEVERALVRRLEAPVPPGAFLGGGEGVPPGRVRAMLAALVLLGLAVASTAPTGATPETPMGLAADLASVGATPPPGEMALPPESIAEPAAGAAPSVTPVPGRRGDPDEARRRRQRLLARAIQNMGVGPFAPRPTPAPAALAEERTPAPLETGQRPALTEEEATLRRGFEEIYPRAAAPDFFVRLGVAHGASPDAVKQAYLALARQYHPDRFLQPALADLAPKVKELFSALNEAYGALSDGKKRADHLARLGAASAGRRSGPVASKEAAEAAHLDFQKGEACARTRDFAKARAFLEAAVRGDPARAEYKAALAATWLEDPAGKDIARAKQLLGEAMKDPHCDRALVLAARLARAEMDEPGAERLFRAACKANPGNAEAVREVRRAEERRKRKGEERAFSKK
jgi:DnaJ-domain-containing protein 1